MVNAKSLIKGSLVLVISNIVLKAMGFLLLPLYTTYLTPADYGILDMANTFISLLTGFGTLCLDTGFYTFYYDEKSEDYRREVLNSTFCIHIIVSIIPIVMILFSKSISFMLYKSTDKSLIVSIALMVISTTMFTVIPSAKIRIDNKMKTFAKINISISLIAIVLNILFVVKFKMGFYSLITTSLITNGIQILIYFSILKKEINIKLFNYSLSKKILRYTLPLIPGSIAYWIVTLSDRYLIGHFYSQSDIGIYAIANKLVIMLTIFTGAFITSWPSFLFSNKDEENSKDKYKIALNYFFFIFSCLALIISVFSKEIVILMSDEKYWSAYKMVSYLIFGELAMSMAYISGAGLNIAKRSTLAMIVSWIIAILNIVLNFIFMPKYGPMVAAITTMICYFLAFYLNYLFAQKVYPINFDMKRIISIYFILLIISNLVVDYKLLIKIPITIMVLFGLCLVYKNEFYYILEMVKKYISKNRKNTAQ